MQEIDYDTECVNERGSCHPQAHRISVIVKRRKQTMRKKKNETEWTVEIEGRLLN